MEECGAGCASAPLHGCNETCCTIGGTPPPPNLPPPGGDARFPPPAGDGQREDGTRRFQMYRALSPLSRARAARG